MKLPAVDDVVVRKEVVKIPPASFQVAAVVVLGDTLVGVIRPLVALLMRSGPWQRIAGQGRRPVHLNTGAVLLVVLPLAGRLFLLLGQLRQTLEPPPFEFKSVQTWVGSSHP